MVRSIRQTLEIYNNREKLDKELVIIQHGFLGDKSDYKDMINFLESKNYRVIANQISTAGIPMKAIFLSFCNLMSNIDFSKYKKIHFIGHSLGSILIRYYLSRNCIDNLDSVIFICGPNGKFIKTNNYFIKGIKYLSVFQPLNDLEKVYNNIGKIQGKCKIGTIVGTKPYPPLSNIWDCPNDGLIPVDMTKIENEEIDDSIELYYTHFDIYQKEETFIKIFNFLTTSKFN